ncbi:MAG: class I SAM-dependent methyltransferase [Egibacteraceae bacterium]
MRPRHGPREAALSPEDWDTRYAGRELVWSARPNAFVVAEVERLAPTPGRALDLGAGEGRNAVWLAERGWAVTATDFSPVGLDKARALAEARGVELTLVEADATQPAPGPAPFDLVVVAYLQLPAAALEAALGHAAAAVAPGGTLIAVGHDADNLARGHGGPPDPAVLWSAEQVAAALDGLTVERAGQVTREVATDDGPRQAIDTLVTAHRR